MWGFGEKSLSAKKQDHRCIGAVGNPTFKAPGSENPPISKLYTPLN